MARDRTAVRTAIIVVAVLVVAVLIYLYMFLNRGDTDSAFPPQPENVAYGDEAVVYDDLGTMTASSDLVVRGTVLGAAPGRTHEFPVEEGGPETDRNLAVRVDEVVYNRHGVRVPTRILVIEGWWSGGEGFAWEGMPWSQEGDSGYFYLVAEKGTTPEEPYSYVSSYGRALVAPDGIKPSGDRGAGPWASLNTASDVSTIDILVRTAAEAARTGAADPVPEPPVYEAPETGQ
jgi:hypothetical protein